MKNARSVKVVAARIIGCAPTSGKPLKQTIPYLMLDVIRS
jgi:hypothetical protein